jgi:methyl-accepting chemotaxis protein
VAIARSASFLRFSDAARQLGLCSLSVRSLAQRSSQAAKDIKDLITNSNGRVKNGVELVKRVGAALSEIVESINRVAAIASGIATASVERSTAIEQVNKALSQMDEVTRSRTRLWSKGTQLLRRPSKINRGR